MLRFVFIATLVVLAIVPILAQAQQQMQDVVYLKNGSIIRGTIIKQVPGISIIIQTKDGNQFVYRISDIQEIKKEQVRYPFRPSYGRKNPALAVGISCLLPGLGQFYNGKTDKGVTFLGLSIIGSGCVIVGAMDRLDDPYDDDGIGYIVIGYMIIFISAIGSMVDAGYDAIEINKELERQPQNALNLQPINKPGQFGAKLAFRF